MRAVSGVDRIVTQSPIVGVGFGVPCAASTVHDHILRMVYRESEWSVLWTSRVDQSPCAVGNVVTVSWKRRAGRRPPGGVARGSAHCRCSFRVRLRVARRELRHI